MSKGPAECGQSDSTPARPVAWARCPIDHGLHLLTVIDVATAVREGFASALCGDRITVEDLTLPGRTGTPCERCLAVVSANAARDSEGKR